MSSLIRRTLAATGALVAGAFVLAPSASAASLLPVGAVCTSTTENVVGKDDPDNPEHLSVQGGGTISCVSIGGTLLLEGRTTYDASIPKTQCVGSVSEATYHARVDWSDGKVTTGTFTDYRTVNLNGVATVIINGHNDTSSTRFAGYNATVTAASLGGCGVEVDATRSNVGTAIYLPV